MEFFCCRLVGGIAEVCGAAGSVAPVRLCIDTTTHNPPSQQPPPKKNQVRRVPLRPEQRQPIRVVLDRSLRIPYNAALLNDRQRTLVYYVQGP